jgi:DhnA family fructose-bisphosphate aldolase class Ia
MAPCFHRDVRLLLSACPDGCYDVKACFILTEKISLNYPGVSTTIMAGSEYALEMWEQAEDSGAGAPGHPAYTSLWTYPGGPAGSPLNNTEAEPGSTGWNSIGVQVYQTMTVRPAGTGELGKRPTPC